MKNNHKKAVAVLCGTMMAAYELVKSMNPKKVYINFICELLGLNGRALFPADVEVTSLFDFPDK